MTRAELLPFRKLYISIGAFFVILLSGTIGYHILEDYTLFEGLYMTVITLATVGYGELRPLTDEGRAFTIILILANIGAFTYFITEISSYFLDGEFSRNYKIFKMKEDIKKLSGHIIICGFGRNGHEAARVLNEAGKDFVVLEQRPRTSETLPYNLKFYLQEDATQDETLMQAGLMSASALITTLPSDADNLFVVLTARELNKHIKIISRASNDTSVKKLITAGANNVIMPDKIGGAHMASLVLSPDVKEFIDILSTQYNDHFVIEEVSVTKNQTLEELNCWTKTGATILGVRHQAGDYVLNPSPQTVIEQGSVLIAMGARAQLEALRNLT